MAALEIKHPIVRKLERYLHEPVNCLTHALGAVFSLMGLGALISAAGGSVWHLFSFGIYGLSSVLLYAASSLLHGAKCTPSMRRLLLKLDHVGIFCLIAGSYTPIALVALREHSPGIAWALFALVWLLASLGMTLKLRLLDSHHWYSTTFYVLLGWLALFILGPLTQALSVGALIFLVLGGLFYTVGAVVFGLQRPNLYPGLLEHHEIWHLFVLAGGLCHYLMFYFFLTP